MFPLACFCDPVQINAMCAMKMTKCWGRSLVDYRNRGLVVLCRSEVDRGRWCSGRRRTRSI
eukprot:4546199-Pyramimonas_sp.AAC.1